MAERRRFFYDPINVRGDLVTLSDEETTHIKKVLRLTSGVEAELLDGNGNILVVELDVSGTMVSGRILEKKKIESSNKITLVLVQSLLKSNRFDDLLPQLTQLGVDQVYPICSNRSQVNLKNVNTPKKQIRWKKIVDASCKQCMRDIRMKVESSVQLEQYLNLSGPVEKGELRILFWEEEKIVFLKDINNLNSVEKVQIMLGPEGGFSRDEVSLAKKFGWQTVSLGKRVLKAETATITAVSLVQYLLGNLG